VPVLAKLVSRGCGNAGRDTETGEARESTPSVPVCINRLSRRDNPYFTSENCPNFA